MSKQSSYIDKHANADKYGHEYHSWFFSTVLKSHYLHTFPTVAKYSPSGDHLATCTDAAVLFDAQSYEHYAKDISLPHEQPVCNGELFFLCFIRCHFPVFVVLVIVQVCQKMTITEWILTEVQSHDSQRHMFNLKHCTNVFGH